MRTEIQPSTFLAAASKPKQDCFCLLGVPLDVTVSFRPGTRRGPEAIRLASWVLEEFSLYQERDLKEVYFSDLGDLALPAGGVKRSLSAIQAAVRDLAQNSQVPFILGGEHLLTLPAVQGLTAVHGSDLTVLHLMPMPICGPNMRANTVPCHVMRQLAEVVPPATSTNLGFAPHRRRSVLCSQPHHFFPFQVLEPVAVVRSSWGTGRCM